ncbi:MAG: hypothetical protein HN348_31510, partial [Proteobacteria bacterium]|nr:hypothetical protein [Pseudomonadota bacterium]
TGLVEPSFFSLDGTLVLNMGMVDLKASDLQIAYWIERPAKTVEECSTHLPMVSADAGIVLPKDIELDGWWTLVPDAGSSCTYSWPADQINLGLGEEDKRLEQAATAAGFDQSNLFGLYVQTGGINGTIFVYGVAGTEDQFAGTESPSDDGSLLTGEFRLEALHLLPL